MGGEPKDGGSDPAMGSIPEHPLASLKLFERRDGACLESPLERFLTPDGCSDTPYFARWALAQIGLPFGGMEGMEERKKMAEVNVLVTRGNHRSYDNSQVVHKSDVVDSEKR